MAEIQSLARGLKILDILSDHINGVTINEIASMLNVDKGSASRMVSTLIAYGYAEKDLLTRRVKLGPQGFRIGRNLINRLPLREAAKPFLRSLMENTGECAHLGLLVQNRVLYIDQVESPASLRVNAEVGFSAPLHCTALGKVLLAYNPHIHIPDPLERFCVNTITDKFILKEHLAIIQKSGFAIDDEEFDLGVRCIAAPIFDFREKVIGAMGISGPATRITADNIQALIDVVLSTCKALSDKMRFIVPSE